MLWQLFNIVNVVDGLIVVGNGDDFIVTFSLIFHPHDSDNFGINKGEDFQLDTAQDQNIQRVMIVSVGHGNEPIIGRIMNSTE